MSRRHRREILRHNRLRWLYGRGDWLYDCVVAFWKAEFDATLTKDGMPRLRHKEPKC